MSFGIEAIEIYFPRTFVDQKDLCILLFTQKNMQESQRANTPKDSDSSSSLLHILLKMSTPSRSQVTPNIFSCSAIDVQTRHSSFASRTAGGRHRESR